MRRKHMTLLIMVASLGLLLVLLSLTEDHTTLTLAAPKPSGAFAGLSGESLASLYQTQIMCTVTTTTTDSLADSNNYTYTNAATLSPYTGLALATSPDAQERQVEPEDDWFRLDNAEIGATYEVKAVPDKTNNYNLGIIVYDANLTPIITDTNTTDYSAEVALTADSYGPYFFKVFQVSQQCTGETYHLDFSSTTPTATSTSTPSTPTEADNYEQNDSFDEAYELPVVTSVTLEDLDGLANFYPSGDEDWFKFWTKDGFWYRATTSELNGVDTYVEIRNRNNNVVESDDDGGGGYASQAEWEAQYDGFYYIRVTNQVGTTGEYDLTVAETSAPATATPGTSPGRDSQADSCEDNLDFDNACVIPVNQSLNFNFVPPYDYGGTDNDFYKIWVKPGLHFECATSNLDAGIDPNMIVFNGPSWDNAIGGNDDAKPGDYNSAFNYYSTYEGWLYVLVGTGDRTPSDVHNSKYTLRCDMRAPGQPTATPTPEGAEPTRTPQPTPTTGPGTPTATPTPPGTLGATPTSEGLTVRALTTPTPAPVTTPAPRFIPISLLVYYDGNDDHQPGAGEGIAGVSAQAYEVAANQLLAQGFTDEQGNLAFTVQAQGIVRVSVPFLGFNQLVTGEGASIYLRVPPQSATRGVP